MKTLNKLRNSLHKLDIRNWQYLFLASSFSIILSLLWFYLQAISKVNLGFLSIIFGIIQGLLAYFFMEEKGQANKVFFSLFFSVFSLFLAKYLLFEHLYDWYLSAYIDKSIVNFQLIVFYLNAFNMDSLMLFTDQISLVFDVWDIIWISIILLSSLQYIILDFTELKADEDSELRHKFRKRRFE
jgi:hypothetical protein